MNQKKKNSIQLFELVNHLSWDAMNQTNTYLITYDVPFLFIVIVFEQLRFIGRQVHWCLVNKKKNFKKTGNVTQFQDYSMLSSIIQRYLLIISKHRFDAFPWKFDKDNRWSCIVDNVDRQIMNENRIIAGFLSCDSLRHCHFHSWMPRRIKF